jgi:F0F1-type ATP synthase membrane subunit b/b'
MVLVTGNWKMWFAGLAASLVIFGVLFFTVIKPNSDTANQAVRSGMQQSQQAINQAQQQLSNASGQAKGAGKSASGQANAANSQAQQTLSKAAKLTQCVAAAGTDATKLQTCQVKFGH